MAGKIYVINEQIEQVKKTLHKEGVDFENDGIIQKVEERKNGKKYSFSEHLRGLIFSLLSSQRPWKQIEDNVDEIDKIFHDYDPDYLRSKDSSDEIVTRIKEMKCGNRNIIAQVESLPNNVDVFYEIEAEHQSLDNFLDGKGGTPYEVAQELASGKKFKLKQVGLALALEYLRNVGIDTVKPDLHICRIIGPERLDFVIEDRKPSPEKAFKIMMDVADQLRVSPAYLDSLLWLFGSNICGGNPECKNAW